MSSTCAGAVTSAPATSPACASSRSTATSSSASAPSLAARTRLAIAIATLGGLGRAPLDAELHRGLRSIPGLGPWTVAEIVQCTHGDPDSVSVFDFHLADTVCWFFDRRPGDDRRMLELLEPWRGDRQRVVRLLRASGFRKPSFAPRLHPEDHRRR